MRQSRRSTRSRKSSRTTGSRRNGKGSDAISLLKADHKQVKKWFGEFEKARSARQQELAQKICMALKAHTIIEEEIFYPAFLEATGAKDIHHEAEVEHDGAKKLISEIEAAGPDDDYFEARVNVLSEMINHHVNEEEKSGGMFAKARDADMDLAALGEQLQQRKDEVMAQGEPSASGERADRASSRRGRGRIAGLFGRNGRGRDARHRAS
jgi:hemerythrin superfamily protein